MTAHKNKWEPSQYDWVKGEEGWELERPGSKSPRTRIHVTNGAVGEAVMQNLFELKMLTGRALKEAEVHFG